MIALTNELPPVQVKTTVPMIEAAAKPELEPLAEPEVIAVAEDQDQQAQIQAIKKLAEKIKYERQCRSVMGDVGALLFFTYAALRQEWTLEALALWTRMMRDAINSEREVFRPVRTDTTGKVLLSRNTKIEKIQVSFWKKYNPLTTKFPSRNSSGWIYRLVNTPVVGVHEEAGKWSGNLISILELKTGALFHHFISESKSFKLSDEQVFYVLATVDEKMSLHPNASIYVQHPRLVFIPEYKSLAQEVTVQPHLQVVYNDVFELFTEHVELSDPVVFKFMSSEQSIICSNWRVETYPQAIAPFHVNVKANPFLSKFTKQRKNKSGNLIELKNDIDTAQNLNAAIYGIASRMDKEFKKYRVVVQGSWDSLNPPKARKKLEPKNSTK